MITPPFLLLTITIVALAAVGAFLVWVWPADEKE